MNKRLTVHCGIAMLHLRPTRNCTWYCAIFCFGASLVLLVSAHLYHDDFKDRVQVVFLLIATHSPVMGTTYHKDAEQAALWSSVSYFILGVLLLLFDCFATRQQQRRDHHTPLVGTLLFCLFIMNAVFSARHASVAFQCSTGYVMVQPPDCRVELLPAQRCH